MPRYTVNEAARVLGVGSEAVRKRVARGSLRSEMEGGTRYVFLEDGPDAGSTDVPTGESEALISAKDETIRLLTDQLEAERKANEENRRIIAALTSRIPQLEAPRGAEEAPETAAEPTPGSTPPETGGAPETARERVPWWRRVFGG